MYSLHYPTNLSPYHYAIIILLDICVERKKRGGEGKYFFRKKFLEMKEQFFFYMLIDRPSTSGRF
jgi:hypothetical protein